MSLSGKVERLRKMRERIRNIELPHIVFAHRFEFFGMQPDITDPVQRCFVSASPYMPLASPAAVTSAKCMRMRSPLSSVWHSILRRRRRIGHTVENLRRIARYRRARTRLRKTLSCQRRTELLRYGRNDPWVERFAVLLGKVRRRIRKRFRQSRLAIVQPWHFVMHSVPQRFPA